MRATEAKGTLADVPTPTQASFSTPAEVPDSTLRYVVSLLRRSSGDLVPLSPQLALDSVDRSIIRGLEQVPRDTLAAALLNIASDHEPKGSATPLQGTAVFFYVMMRLPEEPLMRLFLSSEAPDEAREGISRALSWRERIAPDPDPVRLWFVRSIGEQVMYARPAHPSDLALWRFVLDMLRLEASAGRNGSALILADSVVMRALSVNPGR